VFSAILLSLVLADVRNCACDPAKPETMEARECSLCREAEMQPADQPVFFVKDANPGKANRTLALPRKHYPGPGSLSEMSAEERAVLWTEAVAKAKAIWGDAWGIAYNGDERRTQCHTHLHIGKLNEDVETGQGFVVASSPAEMPLPPPGEGLWVHPLNGKLHVHPGGLVNETVLMR
jgi:hypothetical protein